MGSHLVRESFLVGRGGNVATEGTGSQPVPAIPCPCRFAAGALPACPRSSADQTSPSNGLPRRDAMVEEDTLTAVAENHRGSSVGANVRSYTCSRTARGSIL